jgi:hypothetical protein
MNEPPAETTPFNLDEWPEEGQCVRYADGSSVCVGSEGIVLTEAKSPYLVQPSTPDASLEEPSP